MSNNIKKISSQVLQEQAVVAWDKFSSQHPDACAELSLEQLAHFKQACALSDFILRSAQQAPALVIELFKQDNLYTAVFHDYKSMLTPHIEKCTSEKELHTALRKFRLQEMVRIAVGDLLFNIPLEHSLENLSELADQLILSSLAWLTDFCQKQWGTPMNAEGDIQPLLVYGMGKLGGRELNFSSDIDLIFTYPEEGETQGTRRSISNQQFFIRLGQKLIASLHQITADGFVYRVDMRLRPFGESGPLVLSFNAVETYYQVQGRDWERYAMLKARIICDKDQRSPYQGVLETLLKPFVFRRYIDFSVIDSLRRMKNMIAQEVRRKHLRNNIKLGAGGIREIEFIVQVFQLIRGGREPKLQQRNLLTVLPFIVENGEIPEDSAHALRDSYRFLRRVENIIQALDDKQTQTLPDNELDQQRLLHVLNTSEFFESGEKNIQSWNEFLAILNEKMLLVHQQFQELIGIESPHQQEGTHHWQTLWDSINDNQWDQEACEEWIAQESPQWDTKLCWKHIDEFKKSLKRKTVGERGQQVLDKLIPIILGHFRQTDINIASLPNVLMVIEKVLTRTAYLELLHENEGALLHLIKLCNSSSWIAEHISKYPILLDELIDPKLLNNPPELSSYRVELQESMIRIPEDDLEAQMLMLRQFKQVQQLRIAAAEVSDILPLMKVSDHLTNLAEAIVAEVINIAWQHVSLRYGIPASLEGTEQKGFAVIGYGKTGGFELGYSSDLDLVFLHNCPSAEETNGDKAIPVTQFYIKLAQRIMHIFNTRMINGMLYDLDLRLRPSGNSGLLVIHTDTYQKYLQNEAWTWEHQALVRARAIYGHEEIVQRFSEIRKSILGLKREKEQLKDDVIKMRLKMQTHLDKSTSELCDIKQSVGGLVDIEFLAQFMVLMYSEKYPQVSQFTDNIRIFEQLFSAGLIEEIESEQLISCYQALRSLGHRAMLKQENSLLSHHLFSPYGEQVKQIYNKYLNT